jgi:hypothetical protein
VIGVDAGRLAAGAAGRNDGFRLAGPVRMVHHAAQRWYTDDALALSRATLDELADLEATLGS